MWTRGGLKERAWKMLTLSYWQPFLVSLVILLTGGNNSGSNFNWKANRSNPWPFPQYIAQSEGETLVRLIPFFIGAAGLILVVWLAIRVFLGYTLEVGGRRFFVRAAQNDANLNNLGFSFRDNRYIDIVKTMLWRGIVTFLWFLLLIIPGIIMSYAYSMVPYLLGDNPRIGHKRALELSNKMTDGHKFDIFVLELSFLGWYLLGALALGIGVFFVHPYVDATKAELYLVLRQNALDHGWATYEELGLPTPIQE